MQLVIQTLIEREIRHRGPRSKSHLWSNFLNIHVLTDNSRIISAPAKMRRVQENGSKEATRLTAPISHV